MGTLRYVGHWVASSRRVKARDAQLGADEKEAIAEVALHLCAPAEELKSTSSVS